MNILHSIGAGIVSIGLFIGSLFGYTPEVQVPYTPAPDELGVALPSGTANFESSLASGITDTATTMTLTSVAVRGGTTLSGYQCFAIDEGSAQAEFVCGTASGTSVTGLTRGLSPADGITEDTDLQFSHRRGASVKITDFPLIQRIKSQNDGSGTYESVLSYASGVTPTGGSELADVEYVTSAITGTSTLSYNRIIVNGTAGETIATGNIVYLKASDSEWYKADNDISSTYVDQTLGIAQGAGTDGNAISGGILTYGLDSTQKSMTGGTFIFLSATAGATSTATTSQILGKAISATTMFFDQNLIDSSVYVPTTFVSTTTFSGVSFFTGTSTGAGNVQIFTSTTSAGTWTKPTGAKIIEIIAIGGGGGGGGGSLDTATVFGSGGAGGGGGGYSKVTLRADSVTTTINVIVGAGAAGGAGRTTSQGNGIAGTTGGTTSFSTYVVALGGSGGAGGIVDNGGATAGAGGIGMTYTGGAGGAGATSNDATGGSGASVATVAPTGGGAGGVVNNGNGGNGGARTTITHTGGAGGGNDAAQAGSAGTSFISNEGIGGTGGGGGEASQTPTPANGGAGGAGGAYGGGGGGGGSTPSTSFVGGAGGRGGDGIVIVITY